MLRKQVDLNSFIYSFLLSVYLFKYQKHDHSPDHSIVSVSTIYLFSSERSLNLPFVSQPSQDEESTKEQLLRGRFEVERVRHGSKGELPAYATFKGVRSLKHKYDKNHQEGMRKSSSLHDLSSQDKEMTASLASSRFLSCSGDRLDVLAVGGGVGGKTAGGFSTNPYFTIPRTSWPSRVHPSGPLLTAPAAHPSLFNSSSSLSSTSSTNSITRRGSFDDRPPSGQKSSSSSGRERSRHSRERSASLKDFPTQLTLLPRESGSGENVERRAVSVGSALRPDPDDLSQSMSADETDSNETDELKVSQSLFWPVLPFGTRGPFSVLVCR